MYAAGSGLKFLVIRPQFVGNTHQFFKIKLLPCTSHPILGIFFPILCILLFYPPLACGYLPAT
jgi:hypothetical protein